MTGAAPVVLDAMGGDHGPAEVVAGAVRACREHGVPVVLAGPAPRLAEELRRHGAADQIAVAHAEEAVPMTERGAGATALAASSLAIGCDLVGRGECGALVSA
ncbi:phosphate acyltransferase PlsX, partial [Nonomuraea sp. NPDC001684]